MLSHKTATVRGCICGKGLLDPTGRASGFRMRENAFYRRGKV